MNDSHLIAAEYHNLAAHAHQAAAEHKDKQDHLTGHELSRRALEHSHKAHEQSLLAHEKSVAAHPVDDPAEGEAARYNRAQFLKC